MLSNTFNSICNQMETIAGRIRKDVEKALNRSFNTFDLIDYSSSLDPLNAWYDMKFRIDDGRHIRVETCRKEPGQRWNMCVKEFDKDLPINAHIGQGKTCEPAKITEGSTSLSEQSKNEPLKSAETTTQSLDQYSPLQDMQEFANSIKKDVEEILGTSFDLFELFESTVSLHPENTWYRMYIRTNDNGHVKVKTVRKEPGKDWNVHVEEYGGKHIEQGRREEQGRVSFEENRKLPVDPEFSQQGQFTQQNQHSQQSQSTQHPQSTAPQSAS